VTIVGIEVLVQHQQQEPFFHLLVLDPLKQSQLLQTDLIGCYPYINGNNSNGNSNSKRDDALDLLLPASIKLPWNTIRHKDLQIVLCTERSMSYPERQRVPTGRVFTAAEDEVLRTK